MREVSALGGSTLRISDRDEWLQPDAVHDEVVLEVDDPAGLVLRLRIVVTPAGRRAHLTVVVDGVRVRHDAEEAGPPATNWDRMRLGGLEWRMVEPLRQWDLSVEDVESDLRAYLSFTGSGQPSRIDDGYEQVGTVHGQLELAGRRTTVAAAAARRTHTWR